MINRVINDLNDIDPSKQLRGIKTTFFFFFDIAARINCVDIFDINDGRFQQSDARDRSGQRHDAINL